MENVELMQLVDEVRELPLTVSDVLAQVITECDSPDASVSSLARVMAGDQALVAMVLKLANSAYYGYARRVESLPDAVVLLGFASVKNLAITASITRLLTSDRDELAPIRTRLFDHSLCTAVGTRILGRTRRIPGEKAFVAGLLHDLGLIVLGCYRADLLARLLLAVERTGRPLEEIEVETVGFAHAELGALVAAEWRFPAGLCEALRCHHDPAAAVVEPLLARAVHAADWAASRIGFGILPTPATDAPDPLAAAEFDLSPAGLPRLEGEIRVELGEAESLRGLRRAA